MNKYIVVDIDGTIADCGERANLYINTSPKDWDRFYSSCINDKPIIPIVKLVQELSTIYSIVFCSGRRESCREDTEKWLCRNGLDGYVAMLLRPNNDYRHDTLVKPEILDGFCGKDDVAFILEDRNSMVKKWRELGYTCLQVAEGDF